MNTNYIAGFFDADGYLTIIKPSRNKEHQPYIGFTNNVKQILEDIQAFILKEYGIIGYISSKKAKKENHKISYDLKYLGFNKCIKILNNIPIKHPKKLKRFQALKEIQNLTPRNGKYNQINLQERRKLCEKFLLIQ